MLKLVPEQKPRPRLLNSAVASGLEGDNSAAQQNRVNPKPRFRLFIGGSVALLACGIVAYGVGSRTGIPGETAAIRKLISVGTHMLSSGKHPATPPKPIVVQLDAELVQVTSIALGHPRLAVINGKQVTEGDTVTVHAPTRSVAVTLRVLAISDRRVQLSDGTQELTVHLGKK